MPQMTEPLWTPEAAVPEKLHHLLTSKSRLNSMLAFTQIVRLLKTQPRTGWVDRGVPVAKTESIADHMYRMSIIAMTIPNKEINVDRCVKIALVHDIAESLVGDITPFGGVTKQEKHRRESDTIDYLVKVVSPYNSDFAKEMKELWLEYEEIRTPEAVYVKDIDKFEMIQQAWDYEQDYGLTYDLNEFYNSRSAIKTPEIGELCDELIRQRTEFVEQQKQLQQK
ncbi:hypothetical protein FT663_03536 [Candidozyma haemuli var. vulneris]|uniref:5'-deoxynucleotidase n=1 Tax=Candidozyma haemuli TaxID=45357 RepID=A0A2V1AX18_9ASCO|nr:hypothetical protein CXQ85_000388 [[Candida] haemuloni]KAF3988222.1 hypothetical protein FT662_03568 [[Candida] haemuloni var. vulneris]KAF3989680.1 hypothetical protein FT663_03536 [[Candida] haemuloni var. vulneris]PVH21411.1 hypothetical protein CXQ85_000388 [[Candida] haemuloni]